GEVLVSSFPCRSSVISFAVDSTILLHSWEELNAKTRLGDLHGCDSCLRFADLQSSQTAGPRSWRTLRWHAWPAERDHGREGRGGRPHHTRLRRRPAEGRCWSGAYRGYCDFAAW